MRQIPIDWVNNGIKFTDAGEVVVRVEVDRRRSMTTPSDRAVWLRFMVKDTGFGIANNVLEKLFQSFSQIDASMTRQYGGTALGLAICKQLVELMGGEIGVESQRGQGSTFWFAVQFTKQGSRVSGLIPPCALPMALTEIKVLVADSSVTTRQSLRYLASAWGIEIDEVASTIALRQALQAAARSQPYHLAIVDLHLPGSACDRSLGDDKLSIAPCLFQELVAEAAEAGTKLFLMANLQSLDKAEQWVKTARSQSLSLVEGCLVKPVPSSRLFNTPIRVLPECTEGWQSSAGSLIQQEDRLTHSGESRDRHSQFHILVGEDRRVNQQVILHQLEMLDYRADCVANGEEALVRLGQQPYDLVWMDCQMPIEDGYQTTLEIRELEATGRLYRDRSVSSGKMAAIALTAHAMPAELDKCLPVGMDDYISKSVDLDRLAAVLDRARSQWGSGSSAILRVLSLVRRY